MHAPLHTHLADELADSLVEGIVAKVKLGSNLLGAIGERHAALVLGVEGADKLDVRLGVGADWGLVESKRGLEGGARRGSGLSAEDAQDGVWKVGCEEGGTQR